MAAAYELDRANAPAATQLLGQFLKRLRAIEEEWNAQRPSQQQEMPDEFAQRLDHELDCALAAVHSSHVDLTLKLAGPMEQLNSISRRFGYRARRRERERAIDFGAPVLSERGELLAMFPSLVMRHSNVPLGRNSDSTAIARARLADAALSGLRQSQAEQQQLAPVEARYKQGDLLGDLNMTAANNDFFTWQMQYLRSTGRPWAGLADLPEWAALEKACRAAAAELLVAHGMEPLAARRRCSAARLVSWASVQREGGEHPSHAHGDASLSMVYYASLPAGSGAIVFLDPRGSDGLQQGALPTPPFHWGQRVDITAGELLVFPGHVPHRVEPSRNLEGGHDAARVSISFNLLGDWELPLTTASYQWTAPTTAGHGGHSEDRDGGGSSTKRRGQRSWFYSRFLPWLSSEFVSQQSLLSRLGLGLLLYGFSFCAGKASGYSAQVAESEKVVAELRQQLKEKEDDRKEAWRVASMLERAAKRANCGGVHTNEQR